MSRFIRARGATNLHRPTRPRHAPIRGQELGRWRPGLIRERVQSRRREEPETTSPESQPLEDITEESLAGPFDKRRPRQVASPQPKGWGPEMRLGPHISMRAKEGHRAAVIELRPGLFIVAEVPEPTLQGEFGAAGLLAPLIIRSAAQALNNRQGGGAAPQPVATATNQPAPVMAQILSSPTTTALVNHALQSQTAAEPDPWGDFQGHGYRQPAYLLPTPAQAVPVVQPIYLPAPQQAPIQGLPARWADDATVAGTLGYDPYRRRC